MYPGILASFPYFGAAWCFLLDLSCKWMPFTFAAAVRLPNGYLTQDCGVALHPGTCLPGYAESFYGTRQL